MFNNQLIAIANKTYLFFGVYTGAVKTVDKEAKGVILYSLEDLKKEIKSSPHMFTEDLNYFVNYYSEQIDRFCKLVKKNS